MPQVPVAHKKSNINIYREAGAEVVAVLSRFAAACERASIDEVYADITDAAARRLAGAAPGSDEHPSAFTWVAGDEEEHHGDTQHAAQPADHPDAPGQDSGAAGEPGPTEGGGSGGDGGGGGGALTRDDLRNGHAHVSGPPPATRPGGGGPLRGWWAAGAAGEWGLGDRLLAAGAEVVRRGGLR